MPCQSAIFSCRLMLIHLPFSFLYLLTLVEDADDAAITMSSPLISPADADDTRPPRTPRPPSFSPRRRLRLYFRCRTAASPTRDGSRRCAISFTPPMLPDLLPPPSCRCRRHYHCPLLHHHDLGQWGLAGRLGMLGITAIIIDMIAPASASRDTLMILMMPPLRWLSALRRARLSRC